MTEQWGLLRAWVPEAVATLLAEPGAPTVATLLLTGAAAVCFLGCAVLVLRQRILHRRLDRIRIAAAKMFRHEGLSLDELPGQLVELDRRVGELMRDLDLERKRRPSPTKVSRPDAGAVLVGTLVQLAAEAREEADRLAGGHEFDDLDRILGIRRFLTEIDAQVRQLDGEADFASTLLTSIESSDTWSAALTVPAILEAYFDAREFRPLIRRLRAIEQVLLAAFGRVGVDVVVRRPLTPAGSDSPTRLADAPRDLTELPAVRQRSERHAAGISDRTAIVVDCFSPGYVSSERGRRAPRFTVYDPAT